MGHGNGVYITEVQVYFAVLLENIL